MEKSSGVALAFTREEWLNTGVLWSLEKIKTWLDENSTQIGPGLVKCTWLDWIYGAWFYQRATLYLSIATVMWGQDRRSCGPSCTLKKSFEAKLLFILKMLTCVMNSILYEINSTNQTQVQLFRSSSEHGTISFISSNLNFLFISQYHLFFLRHFFFHIPQSGHRWIPIDNLREKSRNSFEIHVIPDFLHAGYWF